MSDSELLTQCKIGLNINQSTTDLDGVIMQKLFAVKGFMANAGVSENVLESDLAVGCIVLGVSDLWQLSGGDVKFSPVFHVMLAQLAFKSNGAIP